MLVNVRKCTCRDSALMHDADATVVVHFRYRDGAVAMDRLDVDDVSWLFTNRAYSWSRPGREAESGSIGDPLPAVS